jgi:hypothetical protein
MDTPANGNATAASRAENDSEDNMLARRGAIGSLRDRKTVRVIRYPHLAAKRRSQVSIQRAAVQPR